jgi:hypothetical protein
MDLDAKLWALQRDRGPRVLTGATATPIANSIVEAWIMQTYTQPDVLANSGLGSFDAWAATFGQTVAAVELAPDGGGYRVTSRLARYRNVPELIAQFRRTADVRVRDDLALTLPQIKDGHPSVVVVPASEGLADYVKTLVARAEAIRARRVEPDEDNMLKVTNDGRHAALDLRLVGRDPEADGGKLEAAAQRIARIHHDTRHLTYLDDTGQPAARPGGLQIVFCDLSTHKADGTWNAYDELRRRLVAHGVPGNQLAYIHDARTDEARARLFERCRTGQIAVLIGSTSKMGVGTNIHSRAVACTTSTAPGAPPTSSNAKAASSARATRTPRSRSSATPPKAASTSTCGLLTELPDPPLKGGRPGAWVGTRRWRGGGHRSAQGCVVRGSASAGCLRHRGAARWRGRPGRRRWVAVRPVVPSRSTSRARGERLPG